MCAMMQKLRTCSAVTAVDSARAASISRSVQEVAAGRYDVLADEADQQHDDQKREVQAAERRDHAAERDEDRLDHPREGVAPAPGGGRRPRHDGAPEHQDEVDLQDLREDHEELTAQRTHAVPFAA